MATDRVHFTESSSMRLSLSFIGVLTLVISGAAEYYELKGHFSNLLYSVVSSGPGNLPANHEANQQLFQELSGSLAEDLSDFYVNNYEIHGIDAGKPTAIFHGFLTTTTALDRQQIIDQITQSGKVKLYYLSQIDALPPLPLLEDEDVTSNFTCYNGGVQLPNNTCVCPAFVTGQQCETITCLHYGILDKNRCACPPGAYALNCEPRGCLPAVQASMNTSTQSFILVLNLNASMALDLNFLIGQMPIWINDINTAAPGLIDNYIITTYLTYRSSYYMDNQVFTTLDAFLDYLRGIVISDGDGDQPTIAAINNAQSHFSLMHPASNVYVFADSPDSSDIAYDPKLSSNTIELQTIQRMLAWRNKLVVILSKTDATPMDYSGNYYDVFRRVVKATQGDLIVVEKSNIANVIDQLLPNYFQMETMASVYDVNPSLNNIEISIKADYPTQVVYILITSENSTVPSYLGQNGKTMPDPAAQGKYFKLIRTSADVTKNITISSNKPSKTNVRIWINSPNTSFLASSSDPTVDVGSAVSISDHPPPVPFTCMNGGSRAGTNSCRCTSQFTGPNCAIPVCQNGGVVEKFPGNGRPLCQCPVGYGGDHCDILSCNSPSPNVFGSTKRSLAVIIQSSFSQAQIVIVIATYKLSNNRYSQSVTQPSLDALWKTIHSTSYDKSSIFLFTDASPSVSTSDASIPNIVLAAIERQLQINVIITPPFQTSSMCMSYGNASVYTQIALQTGGTILNLCQTYENTYPRDIITEFFTGYGASHHHVETLQESLLVDCSVLAKTQFYIDDVSAQVYAFINSDQVENFTVGVIDSDNGPGVQQLYSSVKMPFFGIYQIYPNAYNRNGYILQVQSDASSINRNGSCSVRIVEKTQFAVYLGFTPNPSEDSPSPTLKYAIAANPVVHVSSQLQSDVRPNILVWNSDGTVGYNATSVRRLPSCRYESFFSTPFTCTSPYSYFLATVTLQTNDTVMQRTQRAYCYLDATACLNGGSPTNGFIGANCENPICQNGGSAKDYKCVCPAGYNGQFCQYITCQEWNYLETHDVRQHEFRQIIPAFISQTESNDIPKQYSLVTFDEKGVTNVISTANTDQFINVFSSTMSSFTNSDPESTKAADALEEAYKITIQPPSVIFLFTAHNFTTFKPVYNRRQHLGTQVNIFSMQRMNYPQQPTDFKVAMIARPTGGRLLPLTMGASSSFLKVLTSIVKENALVYDDGFKNCTSPQTSNFFIESTASRVILLITGNDVSKSRAVIVTDGQGNNVPVFPQLAMLQDTAALVIDFPLKQEGPVGGKWTVTIKTTSGSCFIQARTESPIHVIPGFSSAQDIDFVKNQPFSSLGSKGSNKTLFVTARVTNSLNANHGVTLKQLNIDSADYSQPWQDHTDISQRINLRDPTGCANQFITDGFLSPTYTYQRYTIFGTDDQNVNFQRTFFYTQPQNDANTQCVNGQRNTYGECLCDNIHTGDYCNDRKCLNGGTPSLGICVCSNGFYGDYCENALGDTSLATTTTSSATRQSSQPSSKGMSTSAWLTTASSTILTTTLETTEGPPPKCFPKTTNFTISFLIDASNSFLLDEQETLIMTVAAQFNLGDKNLQTTFTIAGMAQAYIPGGKAKSTGDIDGDIKTITKNDYFGQFVLNAGASMEGFRNSSDSVVTDFKPPFAVVLMGQKSMDDIRVAYTNLSKEGYKLLAIDLTPDGQVVPTLTPVFGAKNVKAFTNTESHSDYLFTQQSTDIQALMKCFQEIFLKLNEDSLHASSRNIKKVLIGV
ncbi:unnamed protein product [Cylicocyclus nassatus]|uniref:EGF-like domain-containing protein n=1 Tax=Cylicocyclus nassatus TaxID=53992 RepID=A0AA36H5H8_CYLNA|nr:unnamed protein product [Cylicocyclus nassatus]